MTTHIHMSGFVGTRVVRITVAIAAIILIGGSPGARIDAQRSAPRQVSGQSTTLLPDGSTLLIGGAGTNGPIDTISVKYPGVDQQVVLGVLYRPRAWHTATLLPDGSVAILGGVDEGGTQVSVAEVLDLRSGGIDLVRGMRVARAHHSATLLPTGHVLVAGGESESVGAHANAELWDPAADQVVATVPMRSARRGHAATLQNDGSVLITGGAARGNAAEGFDPSSQAFLEATSAPADRRLLLTQARPADGATDVDVNARISLLFSRPLDVSTVHHRTVLLAGPNGVTDTLIVPAEGGRLIFVTPRNALAAASEYSVSINGLRDGSGQIARPAVIRFTTRKTGQSEKPSAPDDEEWIPDPVGKDGWRSGRSTSGWQLLPPLQAAEGVTALSGQVLLFNGKPLADVTLAVGKATTRSDGTGRFLLAGLAEGLQTLLIDGRSASAPGRTFGVFEARIDVKPDRTNVLSYTIWMPRIDRAHAVTIPSPLANDVVVTTPLIPGLELHLPKGAVIKDHEGRVAREISITPIPIDQPPFPLPTGVEVPVYFTIQPGGGYIETPGDWPTGGRLVYPNYNHERPGTRINFWHYDPAERGWHIYGLGTVKPDGKQITPDDGVAVYAFTGAMINTGQSPPADGPDPDSPDDGDPVDLATGLFVYEKTDLSLPDVLPLNLTRTYRPNDSVSRPFGIGATHPYAMFLWSAQQYQEADLILPDGGRVHYVRISPGTGFQDAVFEHTATPTAFYKSRLAWNPVFYGWDLTLKDGTVYVFGDSKPLQLIRDRYGNTTRLTWSDNSFGQGSGNILKVTSPNGRFVEFTYDTGNRITQAKDNIGRTVGYTYDASGRLWKVTDVAGGVTEYTYDTSHRMLTIKDPRNIVFLTNEYNANGRVFRQTQADSTTYQFAYTLDGSGKVTQTDVTNPRGYVTRTVFNTGHYPVSVTEAYGTGLARTTTMTRQTGTNLVTSMTDPLNRRTDYSYDSKGNVTSITRLAGTADAVTTTLTYESTFSQIASVTDPLNHSTTFGYDASARLTSVTDALNHATTFTYNAAGQVLTATDALNQTLQFDYDIGDLVSITDPLGRQETRFVDSAGRVLRRRSAAGHFTTYEYDAFNRVTAITDALSGRTAFTYDGNGNLLSVTDARNNATTYAYNNMDRVQSRTDPLQRVESYLWDNNGNLRETTDRKHQVATHTHDALDRHTQTTFADTSTTSFTYDAGDRSTQITDSIAGTITRTYGLLDRLTSETTPEGTVSYTYDAASRRATMSVTGQPTVNYGYDNANRLTGITKSTSSVAYAYDNVNRRTSLTLPNGIVQEYAYDTASQVTGITYKLSGAPLGTLTYAYDAAGNRTVIDGTWARTNLPSALSSATYDAANQILTWAGTNFTYDANGNLTNDGSRTYTWNARNQLTALGGSMSASFAYDGRGRRRNRTISGVTTSYLYDCLNAVQELSGGVPVANFLVGPSLDEVVTRTDAAASRTFVADAVGSSVALTDGAGSVMTTYTYEPFGKATSGGESSANSAQYTGRENDGTGLYFYRARYYHPGLQRFVSEDPLGLAAGPNLFAYASNAPTLQIDPLGLKPQPSFGGQDPPTPPGPGRGGPGLHSTPPGSGGGSPDGAPPPPPPPTKSSPPGPDPPPAPDDKKKTQPDCARVSGEAFALCMTAMLSALGIPVETAIILACASSTVGFAPCILAGHHAAMPALQNFLRYATATCGTVASNSYRQCSGM